MLSSLLVLGIEFALYSTPNFLKITEDTKKPLIYCVEYLKNSLMNYALWKQNSSWCLKLSIQIQRLLKALAP